jgi:hypothetical protein
MKKLLLFGIVMMLIAPSASAQPADAYLALYEDAARSDWCVSGIGFVTMYLFVLPSVDGVVCAELSINVTGAGAGGLMWGTPTYHPDVAEPVLGSVPGEMGVCFPVGVCKTEWIYFYSVGILVQTIEAARVEIGPYGTSPYPKVLDCLDAEPEAIIFNHFYINDCGPIAVDESSWGAIKSLYR